MIVSDLRRLDAGDERVKSAGKMLILMNLEGFSWVIPVDSTILFADQSAVCDNWSNRGSGRSRNRLITHQFRPLAEAALLGMSMIRKVREKLSK